MATSGLSGVMPTNIRSKHGIDLIDSLMAPIFVAATLVLSGLGTVSIDEPFSWAMSDAIYAAQGTEFTWAFVISLIVLVSAWATNENQLDDFTDEETAVVAAMAAILVLSALVPAISSAIESYWWLGAFIVMLNGAGFYLLAYR
ncbi:hypothetical protein HALLA_17495 [Halostagnicola larsenii XH-48]|uniref:Uncharacterized protein n=1 Tax=Halostagnicola larsenii XH-48 TaxID=797299 RepID=W0JNP7_9EURY|nr:hypothetical protein [Halostagnicola larsenii]AHG00326.1 hypothetical protein HALLA_17495 [Halostagnicola larsenii XH-48]